MATRHQPWMYDDCKPVVTRDVPSANVLQVGDLTATKASSTAGDPYAAGDQAWDTNLATTQENFHDRFLGVALERSLSGQTDPIRVGTSGIYEFDCASTTWEVGDLVGPAKQSGNLLEPQKVASVATANLAVGRVHRAATSATKVWVEIFSVLARSGVITPA